MNKNKRHNYIFFSLLIFIALLVFLEVLIRLSIFTPYLPIEKLRDPWRYANYYDDDDFWKLYHMLGGEFKPPAPAYIHPLLGWSQISVNTGNSLGLKEESLKSFYSSKKQILFYGDSFVDGVVSSRDHEIPRYITKHLNDAIAVDLGCCGYGLDQMYLLFTLTHGKAHDPLVIFGILVEDDLDRSVLSVRTGQKPYFIVRDGKLVLQGVPIDPDPSHYSAINPPKIKSYLFRLVFRATIGKTKWFIDKKTNNKILVNTKIIEAIDDLCKAKGYSLLFVLFHGQYELTYGGYWQEKFLKDLLHRMNIQYVDTADSLRSYSLRHGTKLSDFYVNEGITRGHHNDLGNRVISEGLIEYISKSSLK